MKANYKQLKTILVSEVKKLNLFFLALKLGEFLFFNNFFLDLANFQDLNNFLAFNNFPHFSINSSLSSMPSTSLAANTLLAISMCDKIIVFNIDISDATILLRP